MMKKNSFVEKLIILTIGCFKCILFYIFPSFYATFVFWPIIFKFTSLNQITNYNQVSKFNVQSFKFIYRCQKMIFDFQPYRVSLKDFVM
jgi:hypothetical protein